MLPEEAEVKYGGQARVQRMIDEGKLKEGWGVPIGGKDEIKYLFAPSLEVSVDTGFKQQQLWSQGKKNTRDILYGKNTRVSKRVL